MKEGRAYLRGGLILIPIEMHYGYQKGRRNRLGEGKEGELDNFLPWKKVRLY